jgi:hypothetical protein
LVWQERCRGKQNKINNAAEDFLQSADGAGGAQDLLSERQKAVQGNQYR